MVYYGILMETIGIYVMVSIVLFSRVVLNSIVNKCNNHNRRT